MTSSPLPSTRGSEVPNTASEQVGRASLLPVGDGRRSVPEWIGSTPDAAIPKRVRLRVFERFGGICQISKRRIRPGDDWDCDHVQALRNGGEHRESNLQPAIREEHRKKTADDSGEKSKTDRIKAKHLGLWPKSRGFSSNLRRKMDGSVVERDVNFGARK